MGMNTEHESGNGNSISRRGLMASAAGSAAALTLGGTVMAQDAAKDAAAAGGGADADAVRNGRLPQSVCKWCFKQMSVEQLAQLSNKIGLKGIDLLRADSFETLKKHNLICTMTESHPISRGLNRKEHWDECF